MWSKVKDKWRNINDDIQILSIREVTLHLLHYGSNHHQPNPCTCVTSPLGYKCRQCWWKVSAVAAPLILLLLSLFFRYLINFLLDSTLGLVVIYLCLQFMQVVVRMYDWDSLRFGEYGKLEQYFNAAVQLEVSCLHTRRVSSLCSVAWEWRSAYIFLEYWLIQNTATLICPAGQRSVMMMAASFEAG